MYIMLWFVLVWFVSLHKDVFFKCAHGQHKTQTFDCTKHGLHKTWTEHVMVCFYAKKMSFSMHKTWTAHGQHKTHTLTAQQKGATI